MGSNFYREINSCGLKRWRYRAQVLQIESQTGVFFVMRAWLEPRPDKHRTEWRDHESSFAPPLYSRVEFLVSHTPQPQPSLVDFQEVASCMQFQLSFFNFPRRESVSLAANRLPALSEAQESFRFCLIASIAVRTKWRGESRAMVIFALKTFSIGYAWRALYARRGLFHFNCSGPEIATRR